jgi:PII-like signaling protein
MELKGIAKLLRIFIGEADKVHHRPLHEVIVGEARSRHLAGATVWRGILSYGPTSRVRTAKVLDLSTDLPIIIEISDEEEKIDRFLPVLHDLFEQAGCGGLVTVERVEVIRYFHAGGKEKSSSPA